MLVTAADAYIHNNNVGLTKSAIQQAIPRQFSTFPKALRSTEYFPVLILGPSVQMSKAPFLIYSVGP